MENLNGSKHFKLVCGSTPTCLTALDRCTAENLRSTVLGHMDSIPELRRVAEQFPVRVRHTCCDRFAGNLAAEKALNQDFKDWMPLLLPCDVHKLYSCTECAMDCFPGDISGVLSLGLVMSDAGSLSTMRSALLRILSEELLVFFEPPPEGWAMQYREQLFDTFLPVRDVDPRRRKVNRLRRYIISSLLNGRLDTPQLSHFCIHGCCADAEDTYRAMSTHLVWALLPGVCPRFLKSRWVRYDESLDWCGLLSGIHNLLPRLVGVITGHPHQCVQNSAVQAGGQDWDAVFAEEATVGQHNEPAQAEAQQPQPDPDVPDAADDVDAERESQEGFDWKKFMRTKRKQANAWAQSSPFGRLVIMKQIVHVMLNAMRAFLRISGMAWEKEQQALAADGQRRSYQVCEAARDEHTQQALAELAACLQKPMPAILPQDVTPQLRLLRFCAISNASTSLHALLRLPRQGFPYKLFKLPLQEPAAFLQTRACLFDEFTHRLLERYDACSRIFWEGCEG